MTATGWFAARRPGWDYISWHATDTTSKTVKLPSVYARFKDGAYLRNRKER